MHPALSVIFFTVTAGSGYGLLILLAFARPAGLLPDISPDQIVFTGVFGLVLVTAGLLSSTLHLANPRNAWRSFTRFRTSWLSREAVFAVAFYPLALAWLITEWFSGNTLASNVLGFLSAALAVVVFICTAMIYASLKTIRQWNTRLVPALFLLLALVVGALLLMCAGALSGLELGRLATLAVILIVVTAILKFIYFKVIGAPAGPTMNSALNFTQASMRLLDVGHSGDTFHTREFGHQVARARLFWARIACFALAFALPVLALLISWPGDSGAKLAMTLLAALSAYLGVFVERWLFFAEARHVVNLYHGAQRT